MLGKFHFAYCTTNKFNNKIYVGRHTTSNINDGYLGSGTILKKSIKKYGRENFKREILQFCDSLEDLREKEEFWIKNFQAVELGYNISKTSGGWGSGELHPNYGKIPYNKDVPMGEDQKNLLSQLHTGKSHSEETKRKISESNKGFKNHTYGLERTEEWRENISNSLKGRVAWNKGKTGIYSEEVLKKMANAKRGKPSWNKGQKMSEETKIKLSKVKKGKLYPIKKVTCTYCKKVGALNLMNRYHFNNCKLKK